METELADALMTFYQKILKPEFDAIRGKQTEHDERFSEVLGHPDALYHRVGRLEDESLMTNNWLKRIEESIASGNVKRSDLESRVKEIKEQLAVLQNRLESVERQLVV